MPQCAKEDSIRQVLAVELKNPILPKNEASLYWIPIPPH